MHKILIVGTVPYKRNGPSRAFESYFAYWDKNKMAQIFSNPEPPLKGHCSTLFQITDSMLVKRWIHKSYKVGLIYNYDELCDEGMYEPSPRSYKRRIIDRLVHSGSSHSPCIHLIRGMLWRKSLWCTNELNTWLDSYSPECVFLSFSDDFFIIELAIYVANRFSIPIVPTISDDYYFNKGHKNTLLYKKYKIKYIRLVEDLLHKCSGALFISDKIRDKYNSFFGLSGETVYLSSDIQRKEFKPINNDHVVISYFGNLLLDRYKSIIEIAQALKNLNLNYTINVYSSQIDRNVLIEFNKYSNIIYNGSVPYSEVIRKTKETDILLVVEAFTDNNIDSTRYSLSTKAADSLKSGANVFAYGSVECGIIDYFVKNDACVCCTDRTELCNMITTLINDNKIQRYYYNRAIVLTNEHHNLQKSTKTTERMIDSAING